MLLVVFLGNITVSIGDRSEQKLREIAGRKYKSKKGSLAKVIEESLDLLHDDSARQRAMRRQFGLMEQGFDLGRILAKSRAGLYDRNG